MSMNDTPNVSNNAEVLAGLDKACRFKSGDIVAMAAHVEVRRLMRGGKKRRHIPALQPLQIIERGITQCYGGIQAFYICRAHIMETFGNMAFGTELLRVMEIEVTEMPAEEDEKEGGDDADG
jgi:hypothetical protein